MAVALNKYCIDRHEHVIAQIGKHEQTPYCTFAFSSSFSASIFSMFVLIVASSWMRWFIWVFMRLNCNSNMACKGWELRKVKISRETHIWA